MQKKLKSRALTSAFDDCSYLLNRADCFWSRYPETVSFYPSLQANETTIVFTFVFTISLPRSTISPCLTDPCPRTILLRDLRFDGGWIGPDVPSWRRNLNPRLNSTWKSRIVFLFCTRSTKSLLYLLEVFVTWYYWSRRRRSWFGISYV